MARRPLWVSALVFAALLLLTLVVLRGRGEPEAESFFALKRHVPDTLTVVYGPDTTVMVPGGGSGWRIIRPVDFPADGIVLNAMLKRLVDLPVETRRFPLEAEKLDTYGMRHPRSLIRAAYVDELTPDTLLVGAFTMNGAYDYVRSGSGATVALLEGRVSRAYFFKTPTEFRRSRLMPFHESHAVELTLSGPDGAPTVDLEERPDGSWWVNTPYEGPGGSHEVAEYLSSLSHMHIEDYIRDDEGPLGPYGLDSPRQRARVITRSGERVELALGDPVPGRELVYAMIPGRPWVFAVSTKYPPVLEVPHGYFRERALVPFGLQSVDSLRVTAGFRAFTVDLRRRSGVDGDYRAAAGQWLLLRAEDFRRAEPERLRRSGLAPPRGTLTWFGAGDTLARVQVGGLAEGSRAVEIVAGPHRREGEILHVDDRLAGPLWKILSEQDPGGTALGSP